MPTRRRSAPATACGLPDNRSHMQASDTESRRPPRQVAVGRALLQDPRARRRGDRQGPRSRSTARSPRRRARSRPATPWRCARAAVARTRGRARRQRRARAGTGRAGALRGNSRKASPPAEAAAQARPLSARAGAAIEQRPPDQARPPPARRLESLERLGRQRLNGSRASVANWPLEMQGNAPKSTG